MEKEKSVSCASTTQNAVRGFRRYFGIETIGVEDPLFKTLSTVCVKVCDETFTIKKDGNMWEIYRDSTEELVGSCEADMNLSYISKWANSVLSFWYNEIERWHNQKVVAKVYSNNKFHSDFGDTLTLWNTTPSENLVRDVLYIKGTRTTTDKSREYDRSIKVSTEFFDVFEFECKSYENWARMIETKLAEKGYNI